MKEGIPEIVVISVPFCLYILSLSLSLLVDAHSTVLFFLYNSFLLYVYTTSCILHVKSRHQFFFFGHACPILSKSVERETRTATARYYYTRRCGKAAAERL